MSRLDRRERGQRVAAAHRALAARHDDSAGAGGPDVRGLPVEGKHAPDHLAAADAPADADAREIQAVVRRGMVQLQMRLVGVARDAADLRAQAARLSPGLYRQLGRDPAAIIEAGKAAMRARFEAG